MSSGSLPFQTRTTLLKQWLDIGAECIARITSLPDLNVSLSSIPRPCTWKPFLYSEYPAYREVYQFCSQWGQKFNLEMRSKEEEKPLRYIRKNKFTNLDVIKLFFRQNISTYKFFQQSMFDIEFFNHFTTIFVE